MSTESEKEKSGKKASVIEKEQVVEGAKKEAETRKTGHLHPLMQVKMNLLEVSHRDIEEIEKARFRIMNTKDDMDALESFRDFVFEKLTGMSKADLEELCK